MVDRVEKATPGMYRIEETQDPLEEQKKNQQEHPGEDEDGDNFDQLSKRKDWDVLFDKSKLWQRNVEVKVEDIDRVKFLGINLKTDPSLLKIRVFLYDGSVINSAFLSISRSMGLQLKNLNRSAEIDINILTKGPTLSLTIPIDESEVAEEITNITKEEEKSFSKTFKRLISKKTWMQKLGIQDPVSRTINNEILGIYITVFIVASAIGFAVVFLLI